MIGKLSGIITLGTTQQILVDVAGVGYVVTCSARTLRNLRNGEVAQILIETIVREDAINLFGFIDQIEKDCFLLLTTVQGVGAKVALAILGTIEIANLASIIASQDHKALTAVPGIGGKLALRLVTELKDKIQGFSSSLPVTAGKVAGRGQNDALSALMNLGYPRLEAFTAITASYEKLGEGANLQDVIRMSLGQLGRNG